MSNFTTIVSFRDIYDDDFVYTSVGASAGVGFIALCVSILFMFIVLKRGNLTGNEDKKARKLKEKMFSIASEIQAGAEAFLQREALYMIGFVFIFAILIGFANWNDSTGETEWGWQPMITFILGAMTSGATGYLGMSVAVRANVRTAVVAFEQGLNDALRVSFLSGAVMGLSVVGSGLFMVAVLFIIFREPEHLVGFGFGASSIALFARVGGGIYTKAADVGADLVGKVESGIPEDDPRNPGVIADNVGDNVGDVAGMGADLFESYVGSIIASLTLAKELSLSELHLGANVMTSQELLWAASALPFVLSAFGIIASLIGIFAVRTKENASQGQLLMAIHRGVIIASILQVVLTITALVALFGYTASDSTYNGDRMPWRLFAVICIGLVAGITIGFWTEGFTSYEYLPTKSISSAGETGPATVVIQGLSIGMLSSIYPVLAVALTILAALHLTGVYGVAIAAVGMLSTLGITLATDAYGPVADNAGGIAEMADAPDFVRDRTDRLDALGNTTAATGKGFAIGSAVITAFALMRSYASAVNTGTTAATLDFLNSKELLPGVLIGAMLPYLFGALTMMAVSSSAQDIMFEVRRQFKTIPGLLEGAPGAKPDSRKCVTIATDSALRLMILPAALAILIPLLAGVIDTDLLAGILIGSIASGFILAIYMSNAGGAWDNAKKYIENEKSEMKGTEWHAAVVTGDTVGDPFKDTSGPALNILIKLMSMVALLFANFFTEDLSWVGYIVIGVLAIALGVGVWMLESGASKRKAILKAELDAANDSSAFSYSDESGSSASGSDESGSSASGSDESGSSASGSDESGSSASGSDESGSESSS
eukprot:TRINITY_DN4277_c0_g4_i1.p1 TRINITY_DN4277_c0_g4~~TRINITY_DN4277_c0_g4_i1.p1  ORF type:complete len:832 (+),score=306.40 TRINITY_DN4277_c0_g4_i1:21-2516(+)